MVKVVKKDEVGRVRGEGIVNRIESDNMQHLFFLWLWLFLIDSLV